MKLPRPIHLLLLAPLLLANCRSTGGGGSGGSSTPSTSMSPSEYPFDENGNYREDWVKGGGSSSSRSSSNVVDLTKDNPPSPFLGTTDPRDNVTSSPAKKSTASKASSSTKSKSNSKLVVNKTKAKTVSKPAPKYTTVTVKKGDTLYGYAKKYGVNVKSIQAANGMGSGTVLANGRSIKIPR